MPTPSQDPPPPEPSNLFSSCPDDALQYASTTTRRENNRSQEQEHRDASSYPVATTTTTAAIAASATDTDQQVLSSSSSPPLVISQASPPTISTADGPTDQPAVMETDTDGTPTSAAPSRSTTMSPGPPASHTTAATSPAHSTDHGSHGLESDVPNDKSSADDQTSEMTVTRTEAPADEIWQYIMRLVGEEMGPPMGGFPSLRVPTTSPSSFLRPGSVFYGSQQSERQVYEVQVEIKQVDFRDSFLCGYLRIQGLTEDHPTLTTYFEGEIIGTKYGFLTQHEGWGADRQVDLNHWSKFNAFRPLAKQVRRGSVVIPNINQREHIFMRWKEHFLVPDHRVRTIQGASFEGFYYICFNQMKGEVNGIYFHSKSERFQQLELKHVDDRGCFSAMEFR